jgi:hypothetical protein
MAGSTGPNIVNSGLVLELDVANTLSYPGSGTIWTDMTQNLVFNKAGGTQTPLTTFNGASAFDFNGSGYWACSTNTSLVDMGGDCTLNMWFYCETLPSRNTIFEKAGTIYNSYEQEIAVTWETDNSFSYYSRYSAAYDYAYVYGNVVNKWNYVSLKMSSGKSTTARTGFYSVNGVPYTASYNSRSNTALVEAGEIRIGSGYSGVVQTGAIAIVQVYNRMLSDAEILQNYNSQKSRFGLQ